MANISIDFPPLPARVRVTQEEAIQIISNIITSKGDHCYLENFDFSGLNLIGSHLEYLKIRNVDFSGAILHGSSLYKSGIEYCKFNDADLSTASMDDAFFSACLFERTRLYGASLNGVCFDDCYCDHADFRKASLRHGRIERYSSFEGADLTNANLFKFENVGHSFDNAKVNWPMFCPEKGSFIGWKKCSIKCRTGRDRYVNMDVLSRVEYYLVNLEIPEHAKRSSGTSKKCRCSEAIVNGIFRINYIIAGIHHLTKTDITTVYSIHSPDFEYKLGSTVRVPDFDDNRWATCAPGIHFFMDEEDAINY